MKNLLYLVLFLLAFSACNRNSSDSSYAWEPYLPHRLLPAFCLP